MSDFALNAASREIPLETGQRIHSQLSGLLDQVTSTLEGAIHQGEPMRPDEKIVTAMGHLIKLVICEAQQRIAAMPDRSAAQAVVDTSAVAAWHAGQGLEAIPAAFRTGPLISLGRALSAGASSTRGEA